MCNKSMLQDCLVAKLPCAGIVMHTCSKYTLAKKPYAANAIHVAHAMHAVGAMQNGSTVYAGNYRVLTVPSMSVVIALH